MIRSLFRNRTSRKFRQVSRNRTRPDLFRGSEFFENLEHRQLLATVSASGVAPNAILAIDLDAVGEAVSIASNGTSYTFTLASGTWSGSASGTTIAGGVLTLNALNDYSAIDVTDSSTNSAVTFANSGANSYSDNFTVTLDNSPGQVTFSGATAFTGSSTLSVTTARNIVVSGGASVQADSDLNLSANMQSSATVGVFDGISVQNGMIQVTGSGNLSVMGTGGSGGPGATKGVNLTSNSSITSNGVGSVTVQGTGGSTTSSDNYGVLLDNSSSITNTGTGTVNVSGTGGGDTGSATDHGIVIVNSGKISASSLLILNGTKGFGAGSLGVSISFAGIIETTDPNGVLNIAATGGFRQLDAPGQSSSVSSENAKFSGTEGFELPVLGANQFGTLAISLGSGTIKIADSDGFTVGSVSGVNGISTGTDSVELQAPGPIDLNQSVSTGGVGGIVTISADAISIASTASISTPPSGAVSLKSNTLGLIDLGATTQVAGGPLAISNDEVNRIFTGTIALGSFDRITVTAQISAPAGTSILINANVTLLPEVSVTEFVIPAGQSLSFEYSVLEPALLSSVACTQLTVDGTVNLTNVTLDVSTAAYTSQAGEIYTIVSATNLIGGFTGLPDGQIFNVGGRAMRINYSSTNVTIVDTGAIPTTYTYEVQNGIVGRSFVNTVDVTFLGAVSTAALDYMVSTIGTSNQAIKLYTLGYDNISYSEYNLAGKVTRDGTKLVFNFGTEGIGGSRNLTTGDGNWYIEMDTSLNNSWGFAESFYRLAGDVNGDRIVDDTDFNIVRAAMGSRGVNLSADANGDGVVNSQDLLMTRKYKGRNIAP